MVSEDDFEDITMKVKKMNHIEELTPEQLAKKKVDELFRDKI